MNFTTNDAEIICDVILELEKNCFENNWSNASILDFLDTKRNNSLCVLINKEGLLFSFCNNVINKENYNIKDFMTKNNFIGYGLVMYVIKANFFELLRLGVLPSFRNLGFAQKILNQIESIAYKNFLNIERIYLEFSNDNLHAKNLYKKNFFNVIGFRKSYYSNGTSAILMEKNLKKVY